jgi:hypothetical protein
MTAFGIFLVFAIVLLSCPFLQRLLGTAILFLIGLWAVGHFLLPPGA